MKKKLYTFFPYLIIILLLCITIFYVGFYIDEAKPSKGIKKGTNSTDTFIEYNTEDDNNVPKDNNIPEEKNILEDKVVQEDNSSGDNSSADNSSADSSPSSKPTLSNEVTPLSREALRQLSAGTVIDIKTAGDTIMENSFYYEEITDDIKLRIVGKSYGDNCTVPFEDIKYVRVLYYGFDKNTHIGELIVNTAIAEDIVAIFTELYEAKYPIEQMVLVDEYNADDNTSMAANNTSSFNYRTVPGATHLSRHALGLAIDINPLYNPYVQYNEHDTIILPEEGIPYADRTLDCPYYIDEDDLCYQTFAKYGFTWGGFWESEPDYQHFQKSIE